jgi:hypothetical protein
MINDNEQATQRVISKLIGARSELEDSLGRSAPSARYDPVVFPQPLRNELSRLTDDLDRIIRTLEKQSGEVLFCGDCSH